MAPDCVLLERSVMFLDDPAAPPPAIDYDAISRIVVGEPVAVGGDSGRAADPDERSDGIAAYLRAMRPRAEVSEPPAITYLSMVRPPLSTPVPQYGCQIDSATVAATAENLVVLFAGQYIPASSIMGCYLIYDSAARSSSPPLSTVPAIPYCINRSSPGRATIIVPADTTGGGFVLAELLTRFRPAPRLFDVCVWDSSFGRWAHKAGCFPPQLLMSTRIFRVNTAFSCSFIVSNNGKKRNFLCWVDLHCGLLVCDLEHLQDPNISDLEFSFVPLPEGCYIQTTRDNQQRPQEYRTMSFVNGAIKFVSMDRVKLTEDTSITTWTLDLHEHDHFLSTPNWIKDTSLRLGDLWADGTFRFNDLPKVKPIFPILSTRQDDVVYLVLTVLERPVGGGRGPRKVVRHLLSVNTRLEQVIFAKNYNSSKRLWPNLIASDFSAYLHGSKNQKRGVQAVGADTNAKRMKI